MRGVNVSYLESVAVQGWDPSDPWGGGKPVWSALQGWKVNAVRFPLNEASWLDYQCVDTTGATRDPDPGQNYKQTVEETVSEANAAGLYVILDLHWSAPSNICPLGQNPMADADHSVDFWTSIANTFKNNPGVIFEMFNEPDLPLNDTGWSLWLNGGSYNTLLTPSETYTWQVAGMQSLINAVRATGATNVILVGGNAYSNDWTGWPTYAPQDPQGQMGAAWHTYHDNLYVDVTTPGSTTISMIQTVAASVPVAVTEVGDVDGPGAVPVFAPTIIDFGDQNGFSYFGWTWNVWGQSSNDLILDESGTPTIGWGTYYQTHLICRAGGSSTCP